MRATFVHWITQERGIVRAWLILLVVNLLLAILLPNDHHSLLEQGVLSSATVQAVLAIALVYGYLVLLVRWAKQPQHLGSWGWIWRSYVILLLVLLPLLAWTMGHLLRGEAVPAVPGWELVLLLLVGCPPVAWLVFGRNRWSTVRRLIGRRARNA